MVAVSTEIFVSQCGACFSLRGRLFYWNQCGEGCLCCGIRTKLRRRADFAVVRSHLYAYEQKKMDCVNDLTVLFNQFIHSVNKILNAWNLFFS